MFGLDDAGLLLSRYGFDLVVAGGEAPWQNATRPLVILKSRLPAQAPAPLNNLDNKRFARVLKMADDCSTALRNNI